jgi:hypothetical protein
VILASRRDVAPNVQFILNGQLLHDSRLLGRLNLSASDYITLHCPPPDPAAPRDAVGDLLDLGFPREQCVAALSAAAGDANRAATYLLAGRVPAPSPQAKAHEDLRLLLSEHPEALENVVRSFEIAAPKDDGPRFRRHPEQLVAMFGLDPARFDIDAVRSRTARPAVSGEWVQLSEADRAAIQRLQEISGRAADTVAQVYLACDKSEQHAAQILIEMAQ